MMKVATGEGSPSGKVPEQGPDWFSVATEACGGETRDLGYVLGVSVYIRGFGVENKSGGSSGCPRGREARLPPSWAARDSSGPTLLLHGLLLVQK